MFTHSTILLQPQMQYILNPMFSHRGRHQHHGYQNLPNLHKTIKLDLQRWKLHLQNDWEEQVFCITSNLFPPLSNSSRQIHQSLLSKSEKT